LSASTTISLATLVALALLWYVSTSLTGWVGPAGFPNFTEFLGAVKQIAASASKSWDIGGTGSVPAVLSKLYFNLFTIGATNDEAQGNALMVRGNKTDAFMKNPAWLKSQTILLTANSTVDCAVQSCLIKYGLKKADVTLKNMGQAEIISAVSSNNAELAGLWAPNIYTLEEKAGAKLMCSGKDSGAIVGARYCVAMSSCGATLFAALKALGVKPGDPVLSSAFTLAPVPGAIAHANGRAVLVEMTDDYTIDLADLARKACGSGARVLAAVGRTLALSRAFCVATYQDAAARLVRCAHCAFANAGRVCGNWANRASGDGRRHAVMRHQPARISSNA